MRPGGSRWHRYPYRGGRRYRRKYCRHRDQNGHRTLVIGDTNVTHEAGSDYTDLGATWSDAVDGNGTLTGVGEVDDEVPGTYTLTFDYTDSNGNVASTVTRHCDGGRHRCPYYYFNRRHQCDP